MGLFLSIRAFCFRKRVFSEKIIGLQEGLFLDGDHY